MQSLTKVVGQAPIFASMEPDTLEHLIGAMREREYAAGALIYRQGEPGDSMVVVASGRLEVTYQRKSGKEVSVGTVGPGEVLGELSFVDPAPRAAQVRCLEPCRCMELDRMVLLSLQQTAPTLAAALMRGVVQIATERSRVLEDRIMAALAGSAAQAPGQPSPRRSPRGSAPPRRGAPVHKPVDFSKVPLRAGLTANELETLAGAGSVLAFREGEPLCQEGEFGPCCFIILSGRADVVRRSGRGYRRLARIHAGDLVGQIALVADVPRTATILAGCDVLALELTRDVFESLLQASHPLAIKFQQQLAVTGIRQQRGVLRRLERVSVREALPAESAVALAEERPAAAPPPRRAAQPTGPPRPAVKEEVETCLQDYLAGLGEWGISMEELDGAEVSRPDGLPSRAELDARRRE